MHMKSFTHGSLCNTASGCLGSRDLHHLFLTSLPAVILHGHTSHPIGPSTYGSSAAPTQEYAFDAVLLDFDGTILDTTQAVIKFWHSIAADLGINPSTVLSTSHGCRTIDTLALYDPTKANWDYVSAMESRIPYEFSTGVNVSENARARWGIVTSGTQALINGWIDRLGLVRPSILVTAKDVQIGKPDPQGYLLGRDRLGLGVEKSRVLVVEDAPAGIRAGKAAGFEVLAVRTSHSLEELSLAGPDWIVEDLRSVRVVGVQGGWLGLRLGGLLFR
ncbi:HAD-like protein [Aspergillus sclerotioniger CBS 115572]|uniref:HAD-like protein n=1 Tax=Aspergillus sclerotioniger CBS 115572 TaxID=1450535 RepID=A0A317XFB2_9EURO|nr:HAD-like protein [Aspergillus sclerotioniger CBS 115572]PWY95410.1 HAD-like protein [Aspergillus sclerotioniger CBS 115572]